MDPPQTQHLNFEWHPVHDGAWERDIDECETFYRLLARKKQSHPVTATASFITCASGDVNPREATSRTRAALRKAWIALRWKHPTLGSHVEYDLDTDRWKRVYRPFRDAEEREHWVRTTFKVVNAGIGAHRWFNENAAPSEFATLFLVRCNGATEIQETVFLQCPHDITDGIGTLQLINQLFEQAALAYDQGADYALPQWGGEIETLSPCLRAAADIPASLSKDKSARFKEIQSRNATLYNHPHLLCLPRSSTASRGKTQRRALPVSRETTEDILRRCKPISPGVSVTHLFTAAVAVALSELQPQTEERYPARYVNHSMMNLRPYCHTPYDGPDHAAAAYHTVSAEALAIDLSVPGPVDEDKEDVIPSMAISVRDFFQSVRPALSSEIHDQVLFAPSVFRTLTPPPGMDPHAVSNPLFCPVALSSLGKVDSIVARTHGHFSLNCVSAFSKPIGAGVALFLGSWNGKLEISGVFDTRHHDPAYIEGFLHRIMGNVYRGLGIVVDNAGKVEIGR